MVCKRKLPWFFKNNNEILFMVYIFVVQGELKMSKGDFYFEKQ